MQYNTKQFPFSLKTIVISRTFSALLFSGSISKCSLTNPYKLGPLFVIFGVSTDLLYNGSNGILYVRDSY